MKLIKKLFPVVRSTEIEILLRVLPIHRESFGVFANSVLIAIHTNQAEADAHCQRLRKQQLAG
jgi:hypothetical protein